MLMYELLTFKLLSGRIFIFLRKRANNSGYGHIILKDTIFFKIRYSKITILLNLGYIFI